MNDKTKKLLKSISVFFLAVIAGVAYRFGGSANGIRWVRPLGLSLCACGVLAILGYIHWTLILVAGAFYGLSTTYFKKKGTDALWWNWALVGLAFSIAPLPVVVVFHRWIGFAIRAIICTWLIVLWQELFSDYVAKKLNITKDITDEFGRGFIAVATLPLFLIGG